MASVEKVFVTPQGGAAMREVAEIEAIEGCGLKGDRYCERTGFYTAIDECEVTLIEAEDLDEIQSTTGIKVDAGEHRRNLVTRGIRLLGLAGQRFRIGEVEFAYDRPRPPCGYIQSLTERGMTRALWGRGGICVRVVKSGMIRAGDPITVLER